MTNLVKWSENFSVGVLEIDNQHKKLFNILGELVEVTGLNKQKVNIGALLEEIVDYAQYHFTTEQAYIKKHPDFSSHLEQHCEFCKENKPVKKKSDYHRNSANVTKFLN